MTHGVRLELQGKKFGCLTAIGKAPSKITATGMTVGFWFVQCDCGAQKQMRVQSLVHHGHFNCGKKCPLRSDAIVPVICDSCQCGYSIKRSSLNSGDSRKCKKCSALIATSFVKGNPAHNRLPDGEAAFNDLFGGYKRGALLRGIEFLLSSEQFKEITKKPCFYCGVPPSSIRDPAKYRTKKTTTAIYLYNGVDRVDSGDAYRIDNVVPCCSICNYMKQDSNAEQFIEQVKKINKHLNANSGARVFRP
jgi:hypothetical protein